MVSPRTVRPDNRLNAATVIIDTSSVGHVTLTPHLSAEDTEGDKQLGHRSNFVFERASLSRELVQQWEIPSLVWGILITLGG